MVAVTGMSHPRVRVVSRVRVLSRVRVVIAVLPGCVVSVVGIVRGDLVGGSSAMR